MRFAVQSFASGACGVSWLEEETLRWWTSLREKTSRLSLAALVLWELLKKFARKGKMRQIKIIKKKQNIF